MAQPAEQQQTLADYISDVEAQNGLRSVWNVWPQTKHDAVKLGIPISLVYTPLKQTETLTRVSYAPTSCIKCSAVLSPYTFIDFAAKSFSCPFCSTNQQLPQAYHQITEQRKPAELHPGYKTIEYNLSAGKPNGTEVLSPTFVFALDTCVEQEQFEKARESLQWAIDSLPDKAKVGLITFGTNLSVHEVMYDFCPRRTVLRGQVDITPGQVEAYLGLKTTAQRFVLPLSECRESLLSIVEDLTVDPWNVQEKHRPYRCTGLAISTAVSILESFNGVQGKDRLGGRVVVLSSGPCTLGPGQIVDTELVSFMRHWPDIAQRTEAAKHCKDALRFYSHLAERAVEGSVSVHVFACCTEQIGLYEMSEMVSRTGGHIMIAESFTYSAFTKSWRIFFGSFSESDVNESDSQVEESESTTEQEKLLFGSNATIEVTTGPLVKIAGCIGHCANINITPSGRHPAPEPVLGGYAPPTSQRDYKPPIASMEIGLGQTNKWKTSHIDSDSTYAFFFDIPALGGSKDQVALPQINPIQIRTEYADILTGQRVLRVTTFAYRAENPATAWATISSSFDQETAAVVTARLACWRHTGSSDSQEMVRNVDKVIIKLTQHFSHYVPNNPASLKFFDTFEFYPQFMFHFRRSELVQLFGQSPDETAMKRYHLARQTVPNALNMLQPVLYAYTLDSPEPTPVFLDSTEATPDRILLFDSFFNLLVWNGNTIATWKEAGYHLKPEYSNVAALINAPEVEVSDILQTRFPSPRFDYANQGSSQARILLARVNPTTTHKDLSAQGTATGEVIATDDVNLQKFLDVLRSTVCSITK